MTEQSPLIWKPNSKPQALFLGTPPEIKEVLYGGAVFGGKTEALIHLPIVYPSKKLRPNPAHPQDFLRLFEHPQFKGIYFRKSYKQLDEGIVGRAKELYCTAFQADYREKPTMRFTFPSGAQMHLSYMETAADAEAHDTSQYNLIIFEELTHFLEYCYLYMFSRCRTKTPDLPAIIRSSATPGNIGHTWVKNRFIEPLILPPSERLKAKNGGYRIFDPKTKGFRLFIRARATDNVDGLKANPTYLNDLRNLPEALAKARIDGDWDAFSGQVFPEFRSMRLTGEPENALHVIKRDSVTIQPWWPKVISIDWGFTHKTAVYWGAITPAGRVIVYREMISQKEYIQTWGSRLIALSRQDQNIIEAVIDPSANQNRGEPFSIKQQIATLLQEIRVPLADAENDRIGGKLLLHEFLRWETLPERFVPQEGFDYDTFMRIYRIAGNLAAEQYEKLFKKEPPETNLPKLQILDSCPNLIQCIPQLTYAEATKHDQDPEDVRKTDGDDPYDSLRYLLKRIQRFLLTAQKSEARYNTLSKIVTDFEISKDYTTLHHRMEQYELSKVPKVIAAKSRVFRNGSIPLGRESKTVNYSGPFKSYN